MDVLYLPRFAVEIVNQLCIFGIDPCGAGHEIESHSVSGGVPYLAAYINPRTRSAVVSAAAMRSFAISLVLRRRHPRRERLAVREGHEDDLVAIPQSFCHLGMLVCRQQPAAVLIRVGMKAATYR